MTAGISSLRKRRWLALLVVPALLLRGLIPAGFMPIADAGGLSIGLCPGAGPLPAITADATHAAHGAHASHAAHSHHARLRWTLQTN